jgi:hypothetical protein
MKILTWILFWLGILCLGIGSILVILKANFFLSPEGYWRGAIAFWLLSINLYLLTSRADNKKKEEKKE